LEENIEKKYWEEFKHEKKRSVHHPVVEFYTKQRINFMQNWLDDFQNIKTALDVGAGYGFSSYHFPSNVNILDLDFSFKNLIFNPTKEKIQASAITLPFADNSFDLVYGWSFLHHIEDPNSVVQEMVRVTKKYLVLLEPNRNNPFQLALGLLHPQEHGTLKFTKQTLLNYVTKFNLKLINCSSTGWLFAGVSPTFILPIVKKLPFVHPLGFVNILVCEK